MLSGTGTCPSACPSRSPSGLGLHQNLFLSGYGSPGRHPARDQGRLHKLSRQADQNRTKRAPSKCYFSCRSTPSPGGPDDCRQDVTSIEKEQRGRQRLLNIVNERPAELIDLVQRFAACPANARAVEAMRQTLREYLGLLSGDFEVNMSAKSKNYAELILQCAEHGYYFNKVEEILQTRELWWSQGFRFDDRPALPIMSALDYSTLQTSAAECADKSNVRGHVTVYTEGANDTQLDAVEYIRRLEERERVAQSQMEVLKSQVTTLVLEKVRGNQILHHINTQPYDGKALLLPLSPQMKEAMEALVHNLLCVDKIEGEDIMVESKETLQNYLSIALVIGFVLRQEEKVIDLQSIFDSSPDT